MQLSGKKALFASLLAFTGGVFTAPHLPFNKGSGDGETLHDCATARNFDQTGLSAAQACIRRAGDKAVVNMAFRTPTTAGNLFDYNVYFETTASRADVANFTASLVDVFAKFGGSVPITLCADGTNKPGTEQLHHAIAKALSESKIAQKNALYGPGPRHSENVYNACNAPKKP